MYIPGYIWLDVISVLSDPHKRAIYDCLGKKGLEEQGWQIVKRMKTPQEIREEYEQLAR
jgi:DnaJ family protein C protein 11